MERTWEDGHFFIRRRTGKDFDCFVCRQPIPRGSWYLAVEKAGSGLRGRMYPDRIHEGCQEAYLEKVNTGRRAK